jgi:hypothetical protein
MQIKTLTKSSLILTLIIAATSAQADEEPGAKIVSTDEIYSCPASLDGNPDAIGQNIEHYIKEKQVLVAAEIASDCAVFGSSIDSSLISQVTEAINKGLQKKLNDKNKALLSSKIERCYDRYAGKNGENGTLGLSEAAHCSLKVFLAFDSLYGGR